MADITIVKWVLDNNGDSYIKKEVPITPEELELNKWVLKDKLDRFTHFGKVKVDVSISDKENFKRIEKLLKKLEGMSK